MKYAFLLVFSSLQAAFWMSQRSLAVDSTEKIETVLDKLDKKLEDKENAPLSQNEFEDLSLKQKNGASIQERYQATRSAKVKGLTPSQKNLNEAQKKINEYESRIDILESDLRRLRAGIYDSSTTDNQLMLTVRIGDKTKFVIRSLTTKIDGQSVYHQMDSSGLWVPSKEVPIFFGPLKPGTHRVDVEATVSPTADKGLEFSSWSRKQLQQSFSFDIPEGKIRKSVAIEINGTSDKDPQPTAKMSEDTKA